MNQSLIDEIVTNVLAQLQPSAARSVKPVEVSPTASKESARTEAQVTVPTPPPAAAPATTTADLTAAVITADLLESTVRPGQAVRIGRQSILTPSARDWFHSKRITWSRLERGAASKDSSGTRTRWRMILQSVTPTVRALQDGLRRMSDVWKVDIVGAPIEAANQATNLICTAECDGIVIFAEQAELIACHANRNDKIFAAVMHNSQQWDQVMRAFRVNVVCINPLGRSLMDLRNLLRDCVKN